MLPTYENQLIRMREAETYDADELLKISMDPSVMEYYGGNPIHDFSSAEEEINWFINLPTTDSGARWVIVDKASNQYIGDVGVSNFIEVHCQIEIGFKLKKEYWRKGIMTFCINNTLQYGFLTKRYNRIEALVDNRNVGCIKTLVKCGFKYEGLLREYEHEKGGYVDLCMYSILRREYPIAT